MDIKKLKPRKNGRFKQGYINPNSCKKLYESQKNKPIIYRSSYERKFIEYLESSNIVESWGSECIEIKYIDKFDNTQHTYFPDYVANINGVVHIFEVKPYNQCIPPDNNLPKDGYAWRTYIKNISKWEATKKFCNTNGLKFKIITEKTINMI
jgi:hypothetical protein